MHNLTPSVQCVSQSQSILPALSPAWIQGYQMLCQASDTLRFSLHMHFLASLMQGLLAKA